MDFATLKVGHIVAAALSYALFFLRSGHRSKTNRLPARSTRCCQSEKIPVRDLVCIKQHNAENYQSLV